MKIGICKGMILAGCMLLLSGLMLSLFVPPVLAAVPSAAPATPPFMPFGYGFSVARPDGTVARSLGFNWIEVFDPPTSHQPTSVLLRVKLSNADYLDDAHFRSRVIGLAVNYGANIDAYEIGNEPNLALEWGAPPDAPHYVQMLCLATTLIHTYRPAALIVSGGLATAGRVIGSVGGHDGNDGNQQDERTYAKEFLIAGGMSCADYLGYHPLGFRAKYYAAPDIDGGTPESNCGNGLCFRAIEKIHEVMQTQGFGDREVWATEVGWIVAASDFCMNSDPGWSSRIWQVVTPSDQAGNLAGAFTYARANWPWLRAMFVFNLNFNSAPWYTSCEQMRYYSIAGSPAETALRDLFSWVYLPLTSR